MSHKDNQDLRNKGIGGWFYAENELFSVFAPLIGHEGLVVYMAMCRLIPWAAVDPDVKVSVRTVMEASCVKRTTAAEKMRELVAMGMFVETPNLVKNRASTYKIPQLRDIAAVGMRALEDRLLAHIGRREFVRRQLSRLGEDEMLSRFGVRWADTEADDLTPPLLPEGSSADAQGSSTAASTSNQPKPLTHEQQTPSAASLESGVRPTDTKFSNHNPVPELESVSATEASVSARKGLVSATEASVSAQSGRPLTRRETEEEKSLTPLPPVPGGPRTSPPADEPDEPYLPFADCRFREPGFEVSVGIAASWVMSQIGVAVSRRLEKVLVAALTHRCKEQTRETLQDAARMAVGNMRVYRRDAELMRYPWGMVKFFGEGHWERPRTWPYDRERLAQQQRAAVGTADRSDVPKMNEWEKVLVRLKMDLQSLPAHEKVEALNAFEHGLRHTRLTDQNYDGDQAVWTISTADVQRTVSALTLLRRHIDRAGAYGVVQIKPVAIEAAE